MSYKSIISYSIGLFAIFIISHSRADSWSSLGQHDQMKQHVIADVGVVSKVSPISNNNLSGDTFQINGRCFVFLGYPGYFGYKDKPALLLVNEQKNVRLALLELEVGSINVAFQSIIMTECPSPSNVIPYSDDPEERLRILKKQREELNKFLEELK